MLLAIYIDSYLFVFLTGILDRGLGINEKLSICSGAISLCRKFVALPQRSKAKSGIGLACYMTTKVGNGRYSVEIDLLTILAVGGMCNIGNPIETCLAEYTYR